MKIQIVSDIHLEASNYTKLQVNADVLVIAGDLSEDKSLLNKFFSSISSDTPILIVLGNHDYYDNAIDDAANELKRELSPFKNIQVLNREHVDIKGTRFIGCTLWPDFQANGMAWFEKGVSWCQEHVGDFSRIYQPGSRSKLLTTDSMIKEAHKDHDYLQYMLKACEFAGPRVVITHFPPLIKSLSGLRVADLALAYCANEYPELVGFSDLWIHGHIHRSVDYFEADTRITSNPRGWRRILNEAENKNFQPNLVVTV